MKNKIILYLFLVFILIGCSTTNFMGAVSYKTGFISSERWYINPDYNATLPSGTAGYGASAERLKDKFIIKYYRFDEKGNDTIEISKHDLWLVKHNGKRFNKQDDDNLFYYIKTKKGKFQKARDNYYHDLIPITKDIELPVKTCSLNGWCELYPTYDGQTLYIKQSILLKRLSDK